MKKIISLIVIISVFISSFSIFTASAKENEIELNVLDEKVYLNLNYYPNWEMTTIENDAITFQNKGRYLSIDNPRFKCPKNISYKVYADPYFKIKVNLDGSEYKTLQGNYNNYLYIRFNDDNNKTQELKLNFKVNKSNKALPYLDVPKWANNHVSLLKEKNLSYEYYNFAEEFGFFRSNMPVYRISAADYILNILNINSRLGDYSVNKRVFADYNDETLLMANALGIMNGTKIGYYTYSNCYDPVTRAEFFAMIYRAFKGTNYLKESSTEVNSLKNFKDYKMLDSKGFSWFKSTAKFLVENGYIKGSDGYLNLNSEITNAERVVILARLINPNIDNENYPYKNYLKDIKEEYPILEDFIDINGEVTKEKNITCHTYKISDIEKLDIELTSLNSFYHRYLNYLGFRYEDAYLIRKNKKSKVAVDFGYIDDTYYIKSKKIS